jgi:hypothetical protein
VPGVGGCVSVNRTLEDGGDESSKPAIWPEPGFNRPVGQRSRDRRRGARRDGCRGDRSNNVTIRMASEMTGAVALDMPGRVGVVPEVDMGMI